MQRLLDIICCRIVRLWLVPRAEGSDVPLPKLLLVWINDHIERCRLCRLEIRHIRLTNVVLHRANRKVGASNLDPLFAQRVMDRVRREDAARNRLRAHRNAAIAMASAFSLLIVGLVVLSEYNALQAEWLRTVQPAPEPPRPVVALVPPFPEHDPFQPPSLEVSATLDQPNLSNLVVEQPALVRSYFAPGRPAKPAHVKTHDMASRRPMPTIPNLLPRIASYSDLSSSTPTLLSPVNGEPVQHTKGVHDGLLHSHAPTLSNGAAETPSNVGITPAK
jgi:hypothetical protein